MTDHIKAARSIWGESAILPLDELERFYAMAFRQGMERAAEIADDLPAPASCSGSERSLWDVASTEIADAIRAEAHAQNQTEEPYT